MRFDILNHLRMNLEYNRQTDRTIVSSSGKSSESVQCAMLKACDACADMGQLQRTVPI